MGAMLIVGNADATPLTTGTGSLSINDGSSWASENLPGNGSTTRQWSAVGWNGSYYCALCGGERVSATSPDGINWTLSAATALPAGGNYASPPVWNGSVWCALPKGGTDQSGTIQTVATSPDGLVWTSRSMAPAPAADYVSLAWNGSLYCAVAGQPAFNTNTTTAATSPDGINWTGRTLPISGGWSDIAYGNGIFCAVGKAQGPTIANFSATSADGVTWSNSGVISTTQSFSGVVWNGTTWVATGFNAGDGTKQIWTSSNGLSWALQSTPSPTGASGFGRVVWNGTVFCALDGAGATTVYTSPTGASWTARSVTLLGTNPHAVSIAAALIVPSDNALVEGSSSDAPVDSTYIPLPAFSVYATSVRTVRFVLPFAPDSATSTTGIGDALNPASWQVGSLTPVSVTRVDARTFDVTTLETLPSHLIDLQVAALGILWYGIPHSYSATIKGMVWQQVYTPTLQAAQKRQLAVDIANPPTYRSGNAGLGGTLIVRGGDYATVTGPELVRKLIYRRLTTPRGGFFWMPDYGLGVLTSKDLVHPNDLVKLKAEIERQCRLEPEVVGVRALVTVTTTGILMVQVFALTAPSGEVVEVTATSQSRIGA